MSLSHPRYKIFDNKLGALEHPNLKIRAKKKSQVMGQLKTSSNQFWALIFLFQRDFFAQIFRFGCSGVPSLMWEFFFFFPDKLILNHNEISSISTHTDFTLKTNTKKNRGGQFPHFFFFF